MQYEQIRDLLSELIRNIGAALHKKDLTLIITVFLERNIENPLPDIEIYNSLNDFVDYFNIMVYDYSQNTIHAPLKWGQNAISQFNKNTYISPNKIIYGVPFYGYKFGEKDPQPAMGTDLLEFLKKKPLFIWNPDTNEHLANLKEYEGKKLITKTVLYPSLYVFLHKII